MTGGLASLLSKLTGQEPLSPVRRDFQDMLNLASDLVVEAGDQYWNHHGDSPDGLCCETVDKHLNELQQSARRGIILHLAASESADMPYALLLMSLVKDVERVGDYAKNLARIPSMTGQVGVPLPDTPLVQEIHRLADEIDAVSRMAPKLYADADGETAARLATEGDARAARLDQLIGEVARSEVDAGTATRLTLTIRFYKRVQGHFLNVLTCMLVPLDRLDNYRSDYRASMAP